MAPRKQAPDQLRARAIELSGVLPEDFDSIPEDQRNEFTNLAQQAINAEEAAENGPPLPVRIRLTCPFGFLDDDNVPHWWAADQEVTDPEEIETLIYYNAEHERLE